MEPVCVSGVGLVPFGEHPTRTARDLFAEAGAGAFEDAGVSPAVIDTVYFGNFIGELSDDQGHQGPLVADVLGIQAPATRIEAACASSGVAVREAVNAVRSGRADVVLVGGAERMTNLGTTKATEGLAIAADAQYETRAGITFPGAYALMARAYFEQFGGGKAELAHIAAKNHENALVNEYAHFQSAVTVDEAESAPLIADPLGLYDACPISDGASAVILTSEAYADDNDLDATVTVTGSGQGADTLALQGRDQLTQTPATETATTQAFDEAAIDRTDVDFAEVHDCFTIAEVLALEGMGFYEPGAAIHAAKDGETTRDGELPINLSGGLKAKGHPVGATGAAQLAEVTRLLRGDHPRADAVPDATTAVAHNAGGTVATATVHVLEASR